MRAFFAAEVTALFCAMPFLIQWVDEKTFRGAEALWWVLIVAYVVSYFIMTACVYSASDDWSK